MKNNIYSLVLMIFMLAAVNFTNAEDGYRLWLKYDLISNQDLLKDYRERIKAIMFEGESATIQIAKKELFNGLAGLLGKSIQEVNVVSADGVVVVGNFNNIKLQKKSGS